MKVIWVADYDLADHKGGAQQTNQVMIDAGRKRRVEIEIMKCREFDRQRIAPADLVILNNITQEKSDDINWVIDNRRYVRYDHDHWAWQNIHYWPNLYAKSLLNIFLSPLHQEQCGTLLPAQNVYLQPSPVTGFYNLGLPRDPKMVLSVNGLAYHKGLDNVLEYAQFHPDYHFVFYGWGNARDILRVNQIDNCEYRGSVDHKQLLQIYNQAQYFIHLPNWIEPFGRTIMEAYLCGCSIIYNDRVGALSYNWDWKDYGKIKGMNDKAPDNFWDKILSL